MVLGRSRGGGYESHRPVLLVISVLAVGLSMATLPHGAMPRPTRNTKTRKIKSEIAVPACGECLLVFHKAATTRFCSHIQSY